MANKFTDALNGFLRENFYNDRLTCAACGADIFSDGFFCLRCEKSVPFNDGFVCSKCGRHIGSDYPVCLECKADMPSYTKARSAFSYEGEIVRLIKNFKTGKKYLADLFSHYMAAKAAKEFADADIAAFVPMTERAVKKRGYNQARLLAEGVSERTGIPLEAELLIKTRDTGEQKELTRRERAQNLKGSFRVHERAKCRGKRILLIDDVMTTGATANAVSQALFGAGAERVYLLTAASVPAKDENKGK